METQSIHGYNLIEGMPYNRVMPLLRKEAKQVLSFRDLMHDIVTAHESKDYEKRDFLMQTYKDTTTACPHYNNTFGVIHGSQDLINIDEATRLSNYAIPKTVEEYEKLMKENPDYFLSKSDQGLILNTHLEEEQALDSKVWFLLAGRDSVLHKAFVKMRFSLSPRGSKLMGIYLPDDQEQPELRGWYLRNLYYRSRANARNNLGYLNARLLGRGAQNFGASLEEIAQKYHIETEEDAEKAFAFYHRAKELKLIQ